MSPSFLCASSHPLLDHEIHTCAQALLSHLERTKSQTNTTTLAYLCKGHGKHRHAPTIWLDILLHDTFALCDLINTQTAWSNSENHLTMTNKTRVTPSVNLDMTTCNNCRFFFSSPKHWFWMSGQPCWHHKPRAHTRLAKFVVFPTLLAFELRPILSAGQKYSGDRRRRRRRRRRKKNLSPTSNSIEDVD